MRYSPAGDFVLGIFYPQDYRERRIYRRFFKKIFPGKKEFLVFDIGANVGDLSAIFLSLRARVVTVECDGRSFAILQRRFKRQPKIILERLAVSDCPGKQMFYPALGVQAVSSLNSKWVRMWKDGENNPWQKAVEFAPAEEVVVGTLDDLIRRHGLPQYIKIDIEGNELKALSGLAQPVELLSIEVCLPEFSEETAECIRRLAELDHQAVFNYVNWDAWGFSQPVGAEEMLAFLKTSPLRSFEIFCYSPKAAFSGGREVSFRKR